MMELHKDIDAFRVIIDKISEATGYRKDVVEKDKIPLSDIAEQISKLKKVLWSNDAWLQCKDSSPSSP